MTSSTATARATTELVGIVVGLGCQAPQSRSKRRHVARLRYQPAGFGRGSSTAAHARAPTAIGATPTGAPRHLFATPTHMSTPQASISRGTPPNDATASTIVS